MRCIASAAPVDPSEDGQYLRGIYFRYRTLANPGENIVLKARKCLDVLRRFDVRLPSVQPFPRDGLEVVGCREQDSLFVGLLLGTRIYTSPDLRACLFGFVPGLWRPNLWINSYG